MEKGKLWGREIPVVGLTGEFEAGKTLFVLSIDPNCFDPKAEKTTLLWDTEGSASPYASSLNFEHRNLHDVMLERFPNGHKPVDLFQTWHAETLTVEPGRYAVLGLDVVTEIEDGLCDWVRAHPEEFGHTKQQYTKMEGLFWGDVKAYWKRILSTLVSRCETFAFTSHMRAVWSGSSPIPGKRAPKGKETLMELASLYLKLDRTAEPGKPKAPRKPAGTLLKSRLANLDPKTKEFFPILPPRLPEATPDAIRAYIESPPDYAKLKKAEQAIDQSMTPAEELAIKAQIAENEAITAQANLSHLEAMKTAAAEQGKAMAQATASKPAAPTPVPPTPAEYTAKTTDQCGEDQVEAIRKLLADVGASLDDAKTMLAKRGAERIADLSIVQAEELETKLKALALEKHAGNTL